MSEKASLTEIEAALKKSEEEIIEREIALRDAKLLRLALLPKE